MMGIIDYGLGNVLAFANLYKRLNIPVQVIKSKDNLLGVKKLIMPGVGAFDYAMTRFNESGLRNAVENLVLEKNIPILGICVGMQILAQESEEGVLQGLGWISGKIKRIESSLLKYQTQLPHMGWNDVYPNQCEGLFSNLSVNSKFYFLHSYYFDCINQDDSIAYSEYGRKFSSAVNSKNIYGVQFHPEKSHIYGTQLLKNFSEI